MAHASDPIVPPVFDFLFLNRMKKNPPARLKGNEPQRSHFFFFFSDCAVSESPRFPGIDRLPLLLAKLRDKRIILQGVMGVAICSIWKRGPNIQQK
jgi:hypothetical protein